DHRDPPSFPTRRSSDLVDHLTKRRLIIRGEMESFNHIADKHEIARHLTVFVNLDRFARVGAPEESAEHPNVRVPERLSRTIDIEEPEDRRFEIIYRTDLLGQLLLLILGQ